ncbi:MAG: tetratricopeptide repeat protein [Deltaproteobacteria bacterium]|nr:MAG: tetratricopeptide repeat protein [Deltaproteobacteria bacterium]
MIWLLALLAHAAPGWTPTSAKAAEAYNDAVDLLNQAAPEKAEKLLKKAMKTESSGMIRQIHAASVLRQNRADEAIALYAELAEEYPDQPEVWAGYSEALFVGEEFDGAREAALRGIDLAPADFNSQQAALQADLRFGDYDASRERLAEYAKVDGSGMSSCLWLRWALETDDEGVARQHLDGCRTADPNAARVVETAMAAQGWDWSEAGNQARAMGADRYADLARIMDLVSQGRFDEALVAANAAIEAYGDDPGFRLLRGLTLIEIGEDDAGLADLESVFLSEDWVDAERGGTVTGIVTAKSKAAWDRNVVTAVALALGIYEARGQSEQADELLARTKARVGDASTLEVARTELALLRGEKDAWRHAVAVVDQIDVNGQNRLGELMFNHANPPAALVTWAATQAPESALRNAMAGATNRGEDAACLTLAEAVVSRFEGSGKVDAIGYSCALRTGDLKRAGTWQARALKSKAATSVQVQNHAVLLIQAEDHAGAKAALDAGSSVLDDAIENDLRAFVLTALGELDGLGALAAKPGVKAATRYNAGVALYQAGKVDEARPLVESACPELEGENKAFCEEALRAMQR